MNLPQLPPDKANHAIYGAAIALVAKQLAITAAILGLDLHGVRPKDIGLIAAALFAGGKEVVDAIVNYRATGHPFIGPHGVEGFDALATFSGGMAIWAASA